MIQFIVLLISTILVGCLLYFYPPNVPLKMKMSLLGVAFLLALGGLFILDTLSLGLVLAAITAISFLAAYVADKRVNFVATTGQTEIVLSFSEEEAASGKVDEHPSEIALDTQEDAVSESDLISSEHLQETAEILVDDHLVEHIEDQNFEVLESIELLNLDNIEDFTEEESILENKNPIQEIVVDTHLVELTEDEFNFLTETREISEEQVMNVPESTDIEDKEILSQRASLLEQLDEVETVEEELEEIPVLEELASMEEELSHDKDYVFQDNQLIEDLGKEDVEQELGIQEIQEVSTRSEEETNIEEAHIMEEPIKVEITPEEPIQVEPEIETPMDELPKTEEPVEEISSFEEQDEYQVLDTEEVAEMEEEVAAIEEVEASINETVEMSTPDMNEELQDMFLSTLHSYEETGDHSSYQEMLVTLVNQKLSDKDFYLFSKLLLDSYVTSSDLSNFNSLIEKMEEKLSHYPVIVEELQRYKEMNK